MTEAEKPKCDDCGRPLGTEVEDYDWDGSATLCFSEVLFDGDTDSHCSWIAYQGAAKKLAERDAEIVQLKSQVEALVKEREEIALSIPLGEDGVGSLPEQVRRALAKPTRV